ncbi:hypothetical protein Y590_16220 [Methylobacterium sp. AMS5]|nr:hypothetical protein Y590_16220 [Methylobacterium sp. AMS5]
MLSLWFWLERWFTDVPSLWVLAARGMVTVFVPVTAIFILGLVAGWSGEVVASLTGILYLAVFAWFGWMVTKLSRRRP